MNQLSQLAPISGKASARPHLRFMSWRAPITIALLGWLYGSILVRLVLQWRYDPNFSYAFLVPAFTVFVLWRNKTELHGTPVQPSTWGLLIVALSLVVLVVGVLGAELFLSRISFVLVIAGIVVTFFGTHYLRVIAFPLSCLFLMIPIPTLVFNQIAFPLQILSSQIASTILPWLGVPVLREGNIINLAAMTLEIAEACSGIRSLLSLITLVVVYGYLASSLKWVRIALVIAAIPIAVLSNSLRIVVTGLLVQYWNPNKAEGFFHSFSGWLVFLISVAMLFLLHQVLMSLSSWRKLGHR
jgi:exosortase